MLKRLRVVIRCLPILLFLLPGCGDESTGPDNHAPTANAGVDFSVGLGGVARLLGHGTDADFSDVLSYSWAFVSKPEGSGATINDSDQATATFVSDVIGTYVVRLTVSDGRLSGADEVTITVIPE